jgi:hypothetical protein
MGVSRDPGIHKQETAVIRLYLLGKTITSKANWKHLHSTILISLWNF